MLRGGRCGSSSEFTTEASAGSTPTPSTWPPPPPQPHVEVTLLATHASLAALLEKRLCGTGVRVVDLGLGEPTARQRRLERLSPAYAARRLSAGVRSAQSGLGAFDVAHVNHPALARAMHPLAERVVVAAWFYPRAPWRVPSPPGSTPEGASPGAPGWPSRGCSTTATMCAGIAPPDCAIAPTQLLADELLRAGIPAVQCLPHAAWSGQPPDQVGGAAG